MNPPQVVLDLLKAQDRMADKWAETNDEGRQSLWHNLHYRADEVRAHYKMPRFGVPKPECEF